MDKTSETFLRLRTKEAGLANDYWGKVDRWFSGTSRGNPLRKLSESDRLLLCSILRLYAAGRPDALAYQLDKVAKLAVTADSLGRSIREALESDAGRVLVANFADLPSRLEAFSRLKDLDLVGKRGHKRKILRNYWLVMASEFVLLKTKQAYSEHLADLLQQMLPDERGDISGDAIRKSREHFKNTYPALYEQLLRKVIGG
jgi:hypothetical protein